MNNAPAAPAFLLLPGRRKAAILLACLGPDCAGHIMQTLSPEEVEQITVEISNLGAVDADTRAAILDEFFHRTQHQAYTTHGDLALAKDLLRKAFGDEQAAEILARLEDSLQEPPFRFLRDADPARISSFIQQEHPQTIALVLAHLQPSTAALILSAFPTALQSDVVVRIAAMDRTAPEIVREVEQVIERKVTSGLGQASSAAGGIVDVVQILNRIDRSAERMILSGIQERNPKLAEEISRQTFTFRHLLNVDDQGIQKTLREVDSRDLALALKNARPELLDKILHNMSERAREIIVEDLKYMGPVRLQAVEDAQNRIVEAVRRLEDSGDLTIRGRSSVPSSKVLV